MPFARKMTVFAALAVLCAGCSAMPQARETHLVGKTMSDYLVEQYRALAVYENDVARDPADAEYFAGRAVAAGRGAYIEPMLLNERALPESAHADLGAARSALMAALLGGARSPERWQDLARAQAMFDCWVERQAIGDRASADEIATCRTEFAAAMEKLSPPDPVDSMPHYVLFFDSGSAAFDDTARTALAEIARTLQTHPDIRAVVSGSTDTVGPEAANTTLALQRAEAVARALEKEGVPARRLTVIGQGECDLMRLTADGVSERKNRRVEVVFIPDEGYGR